MDLLFFIILVRQYRDEDHTSGRSDSSLDGVLVQQTVPCITFTCFIHTRYCTYQCLHVHAKELREGRGYGGFEEIYMKKGV